MSPAPPAVSSPKAQSQDQSGVGTTVTTTLQDSGMLGDILASDCHDGAKDCCRLLQIILRISAPEIVRNKAFYLKESL